MRKVVFDVETSVNSDHRAGRPFPFDERNKIVALGLMDLEDTDEELRQWYFPEWANPVEDTSFTKWLLGGTIPPGTYTAGREIPKPTMLIGHNVGFDILYLLKELSSPLHDHYEDLVYILKKGVIWDTSIAEFYLSGGTDKFPSLDNVCIKRVLATKVGAIKEHWEAGGKTEDIDPDLLLDYLRHDVWVTKEIASQQFVEAEERGITSYLLQVMKSRQATIWMEWIGVYVNNERVEKEKATEEYELSRFLEIIRTSLSLRFGIGRSLVNPESNKQLSLFFFGGEISYEETVPVIDPKTGKAAIYKSGAKKGRVKTKKVTKTKKLSSIIQPSTVGAKETKVEGVYTVGEEVLEEIVKKGGHSVAELSLKARKLRKNISTYLDGYAGMAVDGLIHCNFNYANVPTGRLSCSKPNMQNLTKEE